MEWNSLHCICIYWIRGQSRDRLLYRTYLCLNRITALLAQIHEVQNATLQMCKRSDTLHLNRVHIFERVVQNTRRINHLPSHVSVIKVSNEKGLGSESIGLDIYVRTGNFIDEGGFSDVGVSN